MNTTTHLPVVTNRMSALDTCLHCGLAGRLGAEHGSGLSAAAGSVFHAKDAESPDWRDKYARLPPDWQKRVDSWLAPPQLIKMQFAGFTLELDKRAALREYEVSLSIGVLGNATCIGHLDLAWIVQTPFGRIVVILDLKRSRFTVAEGTDSLQLHGYGQALCEEADADGYAVAIWSCEDGTLQVGELIMREHPDYEAWYDKLEIAALNTSEHGTMGGHCMKCYSRESCPEYLMPGALAETTLGPCLTGPIENNDKALECLLAADALEKILKRADENLKAWAKANGGIYDPKTKKVWGPNARKGPSWFDKKTLAEKLDALNEHIATLREQINGLNENHLALDGHEMDAHLAALCNMADGLHGSCFSIDDFQREGKPTEAYIWTKAQLL